MSGPRILCASAALIAFSLTATAQTYVKDVQSVPKADELDQVVRAQFIKPEDVSPEEYARLLEEAEKIKAFQGTQTYTPAPSSDNAPVTTYAGSSTTEKIYDGRPDEATTSAPSYQIELFETPVAAPVTPTTTTPTVLGHHIVVKGDTLYNISKRYNITLSDLKSSNGLSSNAINIGQTLSVPAIRRSITENVSKAVPTTLVRNVEPVPNRGVYAVLPGDTLYGIARRACVNIADITAKNTVGLGGTIHPGQRLTLPSGHCLR